MKELMICPSILAADFSRLGEEIKRIENADCIHIDVMDGHYVPNLSFGPMVAAVANSISELPLDVHLMVTNPEQLLEQFYKLKPKFITVHYEATTHLQRILTQIRANGSKAGVALNPHTPLNGLEYILNDLDLILIMTVNPGLGGQSLIPSMIDKIKATKDLIGKHDIRLQVDGGISLANIATVTKAGADTIVAGSSIFNAKDASAYIDQMRNTTN